MKPFDPKTDTVMTAYAESAAGPGWANQPLWYVVRSSLDGELRTMCLQPTEQSGEMLLLYRISQAVHTAMTRAVATHLKKKKKREPRVTGL